MPASRTLVCTLAVSTLFTLGATNAAAGSAAPVGNVTPALGPAPRGVSVVASAAPVDDRLAVLIQNGSTSTARIELITAVATSRDGATVTRARSREAYPQVLRPGELALAAVQFRTGATPTGGSIVVKVRSTPVAAAKASQALAVSAPALSPPRTGAVAQTLDATVTNPTKSWTARSPRVAVMCFGEARQPVTLTTARPKPTRIAPGKRTIVTARLATLCPSYLVAARAA